MPTIGFGGRLHEQGASPIVGAPSTASTLLGVAQLGFPGKLVEIDVTAATS